MAFIIGTYNKFDQWDRVNSLHIFQVNDNWYAIKQVELEWGIPKLPNYVDRDMELEAKMYYIYDTYEDALQFVNKIKSLN